MSTEMNPTDFHDRLDALLRSGDEPATSAAIDGDLYLGRRMLRRRRTGVAVGTLSLVVAATALAGSLVVAGGDPGEVPAAGRPISDTDLLAACRDGNQSERATQLMFGGGDPEIKVVSKSARRTALALEAADGKHWAYCWVDVQGAEFPAGMDVYDATRTTPNSMFSSAPACAGATEDCREFAFTVVDRRPEEVAAVEFRTADGERTTVESVDGYVVLNHVGDLPDGVALTPEGLPLDFAPLERITFLDADGRPMAAEVYDGSGSGPDHEWVDGLPSIREFPALRGDQAIS
jgi:hypothetical protein